MMQYKENITIPVFEERQVPNVDTERAEFLEWVRGDDKSSFYSRSDGTMIRPGGEEDWILVPGDWVARRSDGNMFHCSDEFFQTHYEINDEKNVQSAIVNLNNALIAARDADRFVSIDIVGNDTNKSQYQMTQLERLSLAEIIL